MITCGRDYASGIDAIGDGNTGEGLVVSGQDIADAADSIINQSNDGLAARASCYGTEGMRSTKTQGSKYRRTRIAETQSIDIFWLRERRRMATIRN